MVSFVIPFNLANVSSLKSFGYVYVGSRYWVASSLKETLLPLFIFFLGRRAVVARDLGVDAESHHRVYTFFLQN